MDHGVFDIMSLSPCHFEPFAWTYSAVRILTRPDPTSPDVSPKLDAAQIFNLRNATRSNTVWYCTCMRSGVPSVQILTVSLDPPLCTHQAVLDNKESLSINIPRSYRINPQSAVAVPEPVRLHTVCQAQYGTRKREPILAALFAQEALVKRAPDRFTNRPLLWDALVTRSDADADGLVERPNFGKCLVAEGGSCHVLS